MVLNFEIYDYLCNIQVETKNEIEEDYTNVDYILNYMFE